MEYKFELLELRNARYPSVFTIWIKSPEFVRMRVFISTIQVNGVKTIFTGAKPEYASEFSEFLHAKICIVSVVRFEENLNESQRINILENEADIVEVGTLHLIRSFPHKLEGKFKLFLDNKNQKIFFDEIRK